MTFSTNKSSPDINITCPHCGGFNDGREWPSGSEWEANRPVGQALCRAGCGKWMMLMFDKSGALRTFKSWQELEASTAEMGELRA